jgi:hypothetical protein
MKTTMQNQIKAEDLAVMEELMRQCDFQANQLEALYGVHVVSGSWDVELEVYPPGESYPYYFRIHYYLFSDLLDTWYNDNNIELYLTDQDGYKMTNDEQESITPMYWYRELATDKEQLQVTNYVINQLFTSIF